MSCSINVVLLCRNSIVREGLSRILSESEFFVTGSSWSHDALRPALDEAHEASPQLIVFDNGSDDCDLDAVNALRERFNGARLVMLSDRFDFTTMLHAFRAGVHAYLVKDISCERLVATLKLVAMGERVLPSQLADELQARPSLVAGSEMGRSAEVACLSDRERDVLRWLIMGCPNKVISRRMEISEATVKVHVKAVLRKLNVNNRTQAAIWAANHGFRGRCDEVTEAGGFSAPLREAPVSRSVAMAH